MRDSGAARAGDVEAPQQRIHRHAADCGQRARPLQPLHIEGLEESFNGITLSWANLQLPGALTSVDTVPPPCAGSHRLQTTAPPRDLVNYHGCVVVDPYTPVQPDGVTPVFRDV